MADLMAALRNADAAGDTEAATRIAAMIKQGASQPTAPQDDPTDDKFRIGYGRGVAELGQGAKQLALHAGGVLGLTDPATVAAYDKQVADEAQLYNKGAVAQSGLGKMGEFAGQAVTTLPVGGVAGKGAGVAASAIKTGLQGAAVGALQPVTEGDYAGQKAAQTALGAGMGAGGNLALRGIGRALETAIPSNAAADVMNVMGKGHAQNAAEGAALSERTGIGFTPGQVTGDKGQTQLENMARTSFFSREKAFQVDNKITNQWVDHVNNTLDGISAGGGSPAEIGARVQGVVKNAVSDMSAARSSQAERDFGAVRAMTNGAATINPDNTNAMLQSIAQENAGIGTPTGDALANFAKKQLANVAPATQSSLTDIDRAAISHFGGPQNMTPDALATAERWSPGITDRVNGSVNTTAPAQGNLDKLMQLRSYVSKVAGGQAKISGDNQDRRVAVQLLGTIDQDIDAASQSIGGDLGAALGKANRNYRDASRQIEGLQNSALGKLVGDDFANAVGDGTYNSIPGEAVMQRFSQMKPSQIAAAKGLMEAQDPEAWAALKRGYIESALTQAQQSAPSAGTRTLAANTGTFVNHIAKTPDQQARLTAMLSPGEMRSMDDTVDAARRLADRTGMNMSGTGPYTELTAFLSTIPRALFGDPTAVPQAAGQVLGPRAIASVMANNEGRAAVQKLAVLPPGSAKARELTAYLATLAGEQATNVPNQGQ